MGQKRPRNWHPKHRGLVQTLQQEPAGVLDQVAAKAFEARIPLAAATVLFKRAMAKQALLATRGNHVKAARELGCHRNTLPRVLEGRDDAGAEA